MPEHFKNSGTGLKELKSGSDQFPAKDTSQHKKDVSTPGRKQERPNPDHKGGPQAF